MASGEDPAKGLAGDMGEVKGLEAEGGSVAATEEERECWAREATVRGVEGTSDSFLLHARARACEQRLRVSRQRGRGEGVSYKRGS